jgi:hypothetical protein
MASGLVSPSANRAGGDRDANRALYVIIVTRLRYCPDTQAYISEGQLHQLVALAAPRTLRQPKQYTPIRFTERVAEACPHWVDWFKNRRLTQPAQTSPLPSTSRSTTVISGLRRGAGPNVMSLRPRRGGSLTPTYLPVVSQPVAQHPAEVSGA